MDLGTELALAFGTVGGVIAYAIGGIMHIWIDRHEGKKLKDQFFATTKDQIIEPLRVELLEHVDAVKASIPDPSAAGFASEFTKFLESDDGKQWSTEMGQVAGEHAVAGFKMALASKKGAVERAAQSSIERLLDGAISFGNPLLDGLWAAVDPETKRTMYNRLARHIRKAGFVLAPIDDLEAIEKGGSIPFLEGDVDQGADAPTWGGDVKWP